MQQLACTALWTKATRWFTRLFGDDTGLWQEPCRKQKITIRFVRGGHRYAGCWGIYNTGTDGTTAWLCAGIFPNSLKTRIKGSKRTGWDRSHAGSEQTRPFSPTPDPRGSSGQTLKWWGRWPSVTSTAGGQGELRRVETFRNGQGAALPGPAQVDTVARGRERLVAATAKVKCPGNVSTWPRVLTMGRQPRLGHAHKGC